MGPPGGNGASVLRAVDPIVDGNETDILFREYDFSIHPCFQIVSAKPGHILDNYHTNEPGLNIGQHLFETGTIKRRR